MKFFVKCLMFFNCCEIYVIIVFLAKSRISFKYVTCKYLKRYMQNRTKHLLVFAPKVVIKKRSHKRYDA